MRKHLLVYLLTCLVLGGSLFTIANAAKTEEKTETTNTTTTTTKDAEGNVVDEKTESETTTDTSESIVPDSVAMSLAFKDSDKIMPENFRGGDPDHERVHLLEDVPYEKHEHTVIYSGGKGESAEEVADGATFNSDPSINWWTTDDDTGEPYQDEDADTSSGSSDPTNKNMAADSGSIKHKGNYTIGNGGASQVDGKDVTSYQSTGCEVHDCTPPDVWVAFRESAGLASEDYEKNKTSGNYEKTLENDIVTQKGNPYKEEDLKKLTDVTYLMIDEGGSGDRDKNPMESGEKGKTARVTLAGPMFFAQNTTEGSDNLHTDTILTGINDKDNFLLQAHFTSDENGLYVRQNVPFSFIIRAVDNGNKRKSLVNQDNIIARIETESGEAVEKDAESGDYIIRKPNYPAEEYPNQPKYFFVAKVVDEGMSKPNTESSETLVKNNNKKGNITTVRLPVFVLPSSSSFESTSR